jgi:hypothetical protein
MFAQGFKVFSEGVTFLKYVESTWIWRQEDLIQTSGDEPPAKIQCVDAERMRGLIAIVGITLMKRGPHPCHDTCQWSDIAGKATYPS